MSSRNHPMRCGHITTEYVHLHKHYKMRVPKADTAPSRFALFLMAQGHMAHTAGVTARYKALACWLPVFHNWLLTTAEHYTADRPLTPGALDHRRRGGVDGWRTACGRSVDGLWTVCGRSVDSLWTV